MTRGSGGHGTKRPLLATIAFLLLPALLSAAAHTSTRNDGNDSPSKIDLKAVSVSHTSTGIVHKVQTYNSWTPASLQHDSFFVIGINKDADARYERCAFIYFTSRLRGQLSNCGSQFISFLPVAKLNGTTAKITDPESPGRRGVSLVRIQLLGRRRPLSERVRRLRAERPPGHPPRPHSTSDHHEHGHPRRMDGRHHARLRVPLLRERCTHERDVERSEPSPRDDDLDDRLDGQRRRRQGSGVHGRATGTVRVPRRSDRQPGKPPGPAV